MFKLHVVPVGQTLISHDSKPTRKDYERPSTPKHMSMAPLQLYLVALAVVWLRCTFSDTMGRWS